ncbi:MAG: hypothetical protein CVU41_16655 [Chloroflexi bacterium HGW-Chloroflexi-3]|nr:MAG: hypothetical protein CVU41_16655 [Chloroflexi bacterium HGW-Chloroflexi-3]
MRFGTIHIILLFSMFVGLAGCQIQSPSNLPQREVSQLRMVVPGEGYFQITRKEWEENGLAIHDPDQIQLLYQGEPHPYWLNAEPNSNDLAVRFYSPPISPSINLSENVFILSEGQTESINRIAPQQAPLDLSNFQKTSTGFYGEKYVQPSLYLPQVAGEDHWLWALFQPNQPISQEIQLPQESVNSMTFRVQVWVSPSNVKNPVQLFSASINDQVLEPVLVEGQGWQVIEFQLDPTYVNQKNNFSIHTVISTDDLPGKIYLDWIEIEYSLPVNLGNQVQLFAVRDNQLLTSTSSANGTLAVMDKNLQFPGIYLLQSDNQFKLTNQPDTTYAWIPDDQFFPVSSIQPILKEEFSLPSQPIDYLVIAPKIFFQALSPLIDLRQKQGLATMIMSPQQIYDIYNSGTPSVESIKKYMQQINEINPGQLKYLLLVGDYTFELVEYQELIGYVPSFFISTDQSGETVSDYPYGDLNGDLSPDLAVGRIPATTPEQVTAWVEKVALYEQSIPFNWNHITAISDPSEVNFLELANNFLLPLSDEYRIQLLSSPDPDEINELFKSSYTLAAYFGHGSIDLWGKDKILSIPMVSELPKSPAPPVLISFSCLNGYFIHPEKNSLAEGLLFYPGGGVTGIFAPTGQTLMEVQEKLMQFFQIRIQLKSHFRIGNLMIPQKGERFQENSSIADILKTYIFFGDPAMIIPSPIQ